jgi:hypothetical protein
MQANVRALFWAYHASTAGRQVKKIPAMIALVDRFRSLPSQSDCGYVEQ